MAKNKFDREVKYHTKEEALKADGKNDIFPFFYYFADELWGNREVVLKAVQESGRALEYASDDLKGDREIVLQAVQTDGRALQYAENGLKGDRDIVLQAVQMYDGALQWASDDLRGDRDIVFQAVQSYGYALKYASDDLRGDRDIVFQAIQQYADAFEYATNDLKNDQAFILKVMQVDLNAAIKYANKGLWNDRAFVLQAVGVRGSTLQYASETLKGDREVVEKAIEQDVMSWQFAYGGLKADRDLAMKAIHKDPESLKFAAEELRGDFNFMVEACAADPHCLDYVKQELKERIREESEAVRSIRRDLEQRSEELDSECSFFFMNRESFLAQSTWPKFQDLKKAGLLVEKSIRLADGVRGKYSKNMMSISHCWETSAFPDPTNTQLKAVQQYLNDHPEIELVWGDYSSMPQGDRTPRDKLEFKRMLPRINLLYLSTSVVQLVDITYPSRFWTQFESWLAMQRCTPNGLRGAKDAGDVRYQIICIHSAEDDYEGAKLRKTWQTATADFAYKVLKAEDVRVTNLSDKQAQLPKIKILDTAVIEAFKQTSELPDPQEPDQEVEEMPAEAELTGNQTTGLEQLKEKVESLEKDAERMKEENAALKRDSEQMKEENAAFKRDAERMKEENAAFKRDSERMKEENEAFKRDAERDAERMKEENAALKKDIEILRLRNENTMLRASATGGNALHAVHTAKSEADNYTPAVGDNVLIRRPEDEQARIDCANEKLSLRLLKQHTNELLQICTLAWMMESVKGRLERKKEQLAKELDDDLKASTVAM